MFNLTKKIVHDCFTEDDSTSYCIAKVMAFIALVAYLCNVTYSIYAGHAPVLSDFGAGLRDVLIGGGVIIAGKQVTQKGS